ncbi:glutaredoxin-like protein [Haemophilus influenzae]|uniref:Glutaredoxin-like protein n=1 Tax=Haemophilus influenzae TaxID=727 RepID=A0A2X1QRG0_HAEIF|nr:glutaredoxin-like protein [Haemophilus influenzae]
MNCKVPFGYVDILQHPDIRAELPTYANWPTFPQLWVEGELVGGLRYYFRNVSSRRIANFIS